MSRVKKVRLFKLPSEEIEVNNKLISIMHNLKMTITESEDEVSLGVRIRKNQLPRFVNCLAGIYVSVNSDQLALKERMDTESESTDVYGDPEPVFWIDDTIYLTGREKAIMEQLALGRYNKWIATDLNLKECTIANNLQRIFRKLRVTNRTEALLEYLKCKSLNKQVS